jgi:hypothetical protein
MTSSTDPDRAPRHVEVRGGSWEWRGWDWNGPEAGRGVPWLGIILVALGLLFLANELLPAVRIAASLVFLAIGVGLLLLWGARRRSAALYAGTLITALAIPGLLGDLGIVRGGGWTTLALGLGFLFIALIRYAETRTWGWQVWLGAILVLIGGASTTIALTRIGWPVLLVVVGVLILARGVTGGARRGRW